MWQKRTGNEKQNLMRRAYNTPFVVTEKTVTKDENGVEKEEWIPKYKLIGDVSKQHGREYEIARQISNRKTWIIITRYGPKINERMRIKLLDMTLDIENIDNIRLENHELEIRATEVVDE